MSWINVLIWFIVPALAILASIGFTWWLTSGWVFGILLTVEITAAMALAFIIMLFIHGINIQ
jgi:hypothetical protein